LDKIIDGGKIEDLLEIKDNTEKVLDAVREKASEYEEEIKELRENYKIDIDDFKKVIKLVENVLPSDDKCCIVFR